MKKSMVLLLFLLLLSVSAEAKIQSDQDFNGRVAFYCWEEYQPGGLGAGNVWITFVKYLDAAGAPEYWLRVDSMRRDKLLQYGAFAVAGSQTRIEQIDTTSGKYSRVGIRGRVIPTMSLIKAFFAVPVSTMDSIVAGSPAAVVLNFQGRQDMRLEITEEKIKEIITLRNLKASDYDKYK